jgi:hypothetical protein
VAPEVAEWFKGLSEDALDPEVGGVFIYVDGALVTEIQAPDVPAPAPPAGPVDTVRAEQLRVDVGRLEQRQATVAGQVQVDERRLAALQAEIVALEGRAVAERERVSRVVKECDELVEATYKSAAEQKKAITEDLQTFRTESAATLKAQRDQHNLLVEVFGALQEAEGDNAREAAKRKLMAQQHLTRHVESLGNVEAEALVRALAPGEKGPGIIERTGFTADKLFSFGTEVLDRVRPKPK